MKHLFCSAECAAGVWAWWRWSPQLASLRISRLIASHLRHPVRPSIVAQCGRCHWFPEWNVCIRSPRRNGRWRWQRTSNWAGKCGGSTVQFKKHPKILYITACFSVHAVSQNVCLWRLFHRRSIDTTSEAQYDWNINKYRCTYLYIASVNWLTTRPDVMVQRYLRRATLTLLKHRIAALLTYSEKTKWKQQRRWDFCNSICIERLVNLRYPQYPEYVADHLQKFIELLLGP